MHILQGVEKGASFLIVQLYFFYYRTKLNLMFGHFVPKTAQNHTLTPLLVTGTASKAIFARIIQYYSLRWIYTNFEREVTRC